MMPNTQQFFKKTTVSTPKSSPYLLENGWKKEQPGMHFNYLKQDYRVSRLRIKEPNAKTPSKSAKKFDNLP